VKWSVEIFGQPVSWDDAYRTGRRELGDGRIIHRPILTDRASKYRDDCVTQIQPRIPSGWMPTGQVRVFVHLFLLNDIDCDNATKLVFDAVERAVGKPFNDRQLVPCYAPKEIVHDRQEARVILTFDDAI